MAIITSVRIYNVISDENKENTLNEKVCPNFWPVLYIVTSAKEVMFSGEFVYL